MWLRDSGLQATVIGQQQQSLAVPVQSAGWVDLLLVHEVGKDTAKRIVFVSSCALSHDVLRGPELWPTDERQSLDRKFIELTTQGRVAELTAWMPEFIREGVAEMGGRTISSMVGGVEALAEDHGELVGTQFGPYAQSSGSGNAHVAVFPKAT